MKRGASEHAPSPGRLVWPFVSTVAAIAGWRFWTALGLMFGLAFTSGLTVVLLIPLMQAAGVEVPAGAERGSRLFGLVRSALGTPSLALALILLVAVTALQGVLTRTQSKLTVAVVLDVAATLRRRLFDAVCRASWTVYSRLRASDVQETLIEQADRVGAATRSLMTLGSSVGTTVVYVALAMTISLPITTAILAMGLVLTAFLARRRATATRISERYSEVSKALYGAVSESLANMKTVRAYGAEGRHGRELDDIAARRRQLYLSLADAEGGMKLWFDVGAITLLALVTYVAINRLTVPAAELFVLLFVFMRLVPQLSSLHYCYHSLVVELPALSVVDRLEAECKQAAPILTGVPLAVSFARVVSLERVTINYGEVEALADVSLDIPAGRTVAIVGPSGAGKSTVADVILGLLLPAHGRLTVDGVPITPERTEGWRRIVGYVPQESFLFHDTIRANLRWAAPEATDDELWEALRASAGDFVHRLPGGLDAVVGDRGSLLSGGERQRIALARALLRRPRLLMLDEATSALDSENERIVQNAIDGLHGRVAILIITHRLSTVRHADVIHVLDRGSLVESGRWEDLLTNPRGRFRSLCQAQGISGDPSSAPPGVLPVAARE
jgi:ATP-binding cassette, subfamily C, bacterial